MDRVEEKKDIAERDVAGRKSDGFTFYSNRGSQLFAEALLPLGGRPFQPGENSLRIDLLYFDSFSAPSSVAETQSGSGTNSGAESAGQSPDPTEEPLISERCHTLIPRSRTRALDDKAEMAKALLAEGISCPRTYFSPDDVPNDAESLWFVKEAFRSGGQGISVVTWSELQSISCQGSIIQEAIQDLALINERKFTLRLYVLVHAGKLYLYDNGFVVVHALPYHKGSTDPHVQFVHSGYLDRASGIELLELNGLRNHETILRNAGELLAENFGVFSNRLRFEPDSQYCLFGVDLLVRENYDCVLVEINDRPNLVHSTQINQCVNVPMLRAMAGILNPAWVGESYSTVGHVDTPAAVAGNTFSLLCEL